MHEASRSEHSPNNVDRPYELTRLLWFSGWNKGTHLHGIHNGDLEVVVCVTYVPPPLIFDTPKKVICRLIHWYGLNVLPASLCLSREFHTEGPGCIRLQNMGCACGMPLVQMQTLCPSLVPNVRKCFNDVLSTYTPIHLRIEEGSMREGSRDKNNEQSVGPYCCLPREGCICGMMVVLLRGTQYTFAATLHLSV